MLTSRAGYAGCWHAMVIKQYIRWNFLQGTRPASEAINRISLDDRCVVISKDTDFFFSHTLHGRPWKLLLVKTGNISTRDLRVLLERNLTAIVAALESHTLVEIDRLAVKAVA